MGVEGVDTAVPAGAPILYSESTTQLHRPSPVSMNHDALCNVEQYNRSDYVDYIPLPTDVLHHDDGRGATSAAEENAAELSRTTHDRLQRRKTMLMAEYHISSPIAGQHRNEHEAMVQEACRIFPLPTTPRAVQQQQQTTTAISPTDVNKNTMEYTESLQQAGTDPSVEAGAIRSIHRPGQVVAASQDLVDLFFLEGSEAVNGECFSSYPLYGHKNAADRLAAVREVLFEKHGTHIHLPIQHLPAQAPLDSAAADGESREQYWRRLARLYINRAALQATAAAVEAAAEAEMTHLPPPLPMSEPEDPFYIIDLGRVVEQMARWRHYLPMVRPHFAVKCNPNLAIMEVLSALGAGFDCASKEEIRMVMDNHLVDTPDDIIFANPSKQIGDLVAAQHYGVSYVTVDNVVEMAKIAKYLPMARIVIRIQTNDAAARCAFSVKFGAAMDDVESLLLAAHRLHLEVYGVSFHVGSANTDPAAYIAAIEDAHRVFVTASQHGFNCTLLDIGGGYLGVEPEQPATEAASLDEAGHRNTLASFSRIALAIRPVLERLFPDTTIISEPGRYFTAASHALVTNVFAARKRRLTNAEKVLCQSYQSVVPMDEAEEYQYYINDGIYQSFNCIVFDSAHPKLLLLDDADGADAPNGCGGEGQTRLAACGEEQTAVSPAAPPTAQDRRSSFPKRALHLTTIFGPTCDSMDCILRRQPFPEMQPGDWIIVPDMGSYTTAAGCAFNGFATRRQEWVCSIAL